MWELDYKESWVRKNWCFWTLVLENTLESPLDYKEIQPIYPKGNQSWIFIGRTDAEAEAPILWPPDAKKWLIGKDPDAEKNWRWEKGITEDEMVGWHHQLDGHEFEQTSGVGDGRGGLVCCNPWDHKESDTIEQLNWTELMLYARFPELNHLIKTSSSPLINIYPFCLMVIFDCFLLVGWFFHLLNIYWVWAGKQADTDLNPQSFVGFVFVF